MGFASQYVRQLPLGTLEIDFILATVAITLLGKVALHLIRRYL